MSQDQLFIKYFPDLKEVWQRGSYGNLKEIPVDKENFFNSYIHYIAKKLWTVPYKTVEWKQLEKFPIWKMMRNHKFVVLLNWKWALLSRYEQAKWWWKRYVTIRGEKIENIESYQIREVFKKTIEEMWIKKLSDLWKIECCQYIESCGDFWGNWNETHTKYIINWKTVKEWSDNS